MKNVGLYVKRGSPKAGDVARKASEVLERLGCTVRYDIQTAKEYSLPGGVSSREVVETSELLVVLGGDGTFLAGAREVAQEEIPVLGINVGALGFLTETTVNEMPKMLDLAVRGEAKTQTRTMLNAVVQHSQCAGDGCEEFRVLNDVVISKSTLARIIKLRIWDGDDLITTLLADGLIVATPTGSTAYSMAAGGPVCHPDLNAILITPICPHLLTNRPLIVPESSRIRIEVESDDDCYVTLDGQSGTEFRSGDQVMIRKSDKPLIIMRNPQRNYYQILRDKLQWGKR